MCSTPFGIRGRFTSMRIRLAEYVGRCSTPFGIRGRFTVAFRTKASRLVRAQRLSASEVGSPLNARVQLLESACSTPFGIRGRFT